MPGMSAADPAPRRYDLDRIVRLLISGAAVVVMLLLLRFLADVLLPFAAAVLLAYLLNPTVEHLDRRIKRRAVSVLLTVAGVFVILLALVVVLIPVLHAEFAGIADIVGQLRGDASLLEGIKEADQSWPEAYRQFYERQSPRVQVVLDQANKTLRDADLGAMALAAARKLVPGVWGVVTGAITTLLGLMGLIVVVLYLIFLLIDYPGYRSQWKELLPPAHRDWVVEFLEEFTEAMRRYFRGQSVIALTVGILFVIGFWIIGLRMAVVLGLFVGALNMVPYLQTVGLVPALMLAIVRSIEKDTSLLWSALLVLIVFAVVQTIQETLLTPRIMGRQTGLKPVAILLGVFIWGKLLGFLGVLLAIPLTCLGLAYYRRFVLAREPAPSDTAPATEE